MGGSLNLAQGLKRGVFSSFFVFKGWIRALTPSPIPVFQLGRDSSVHLTDVLGPGVACGVYNSFILDVLFTFPFPFSIKTYESSLIPSRMFVNGSNWELTCDLRSFSLTRQSQSVSVSPSAFLYSSSLSF